MSRYGRAARSPSRQGDKQNQEKCRNTGVVVLLLDAHCHLDHYSEPETVAAECASRRVLVVAVTNLPSHFRVGRERARDLKGVRLALGLHPLSVAAHREEILEFRSLVAEVSYVGE